MERKSEISDKSIYGLLMVSIASLAIIFNVFEDNSFWLRLLFRLILISVSVLMTYLIIQKKSEKLKTFGKYFLFLPMIAVVITYGWFIPKFLLIISLLLTVCLIIGFAFHFLQKSIEKS